VIVGFSLHKRNVLEADGTLILGEGPLMGGTALTQTLAQKYKKPLGN